MINLRSITLLCSIGISLIVVVSILGLVQLTENSEVRANQNDVRAALQDDNPSSGSLKILNHLMEKTSSGDWIVKGHAKNVGSGNLRYATINVNFYKNGNLLYSSFANLGSIAPGETKDFEITYRGLGDSPDSYDAALGSSW